MRDYPLSFVAVVQSMPHSTLHSHIHIPIDDAHKYPKMPFPMLVVQALISSASAVQLHSAVSSPAFNSPKDRDPAKLQLLHHCQY